mmetsp:Transcript_9852/g.18152  ORF Transcript_9852/g.18152 Transcript_9852/m.18152 type:complete len:93 (-) Transcript_9852:83-361(-)
MLNLCVPGLNGLVVGWVEMCRVESYDAEQDCAQCVDACFPEDELKVDTSFVSPCILSPSSVIAIIGDIIEDQPGVSCLSLFDENTCWYCGRT